ncbi:hypothetical protein [Roseovarius nubinhibens]|uniref:hypothetical protein n=1 Tax=Roseovarius nubinhibens TaxID=314263 RepID=UPI0002EDB612|nr:hypothetical protein [Roseovarius nubinhibens]
MSDHDRRQAIYDFVVEQYQNIPSGGTNHLRVAVNATQLAINLYDTEFPPTYYDSPNGEPLVLYPYNRAEMIIEDLKEVFVGESIHGRWRGTGDFFYGNVIDIDGRRINEGSGFRDEFQDNTDQINHTFGGIWGSFHYGIVPETITNLRENGEEDLLINYVTFPIGNLLNNENIGYLPQLLATGLSNDEDYSFYTREEFAEFLSESIKSGLNNGSLSAEDAVSLFRHAQDTGDSTLLRAYTTALSESDQSCFGPEVPIDMWPLDPDLNPGPDGIYDQDAVRAKVWKKPIELIQVGDLVVSFDDDGNLVPGPVTRTFQNNAKILLNFHGTRVTPGHVYYRPDSKKSYKYETLIDVLRDDGVIQKQDGTLIRAATNVPVDSPRDGFVRAIAGRHKADGAFEQTDEGRIRLGTRFLIGTGEECKSVSVADLIECNRGVVGDDELIHVGDSPGVPFTWDFGDTLPKPEDFVLACSGTTLEDIYKAAEWESQGPRLPAPMVLDRGPVQPLKDVALSEMPRNEPLNVTHAPMAATKPQRTLNREQRKAMEAQQRKAAKTRKRLVG